MKSKFKWLWRNWRTNKPLWDGLGYDIKKAKNFLTKTDKQKMGKLIQLNYHRLPVRLIVAQDDGRLGIENAKIIVTVVTTFFVDLSRIIKTRDYINLVSLLFNLIKQGNIIAVAKTAWEEIKDASLTETNDLHLHFAEVLDLDNDKTEQLIERAFALIPKAYELALKGLSLYGDVKGFVAEVGDVFKGEEIDVAEVDTGLLLAA